MASGVQVADACQQAFLDIKKGKMYRFIIFHIKDEKIIDIEKYGERDASYDDYLKHLESVGPQECRYGLYDFEYEHQCQGTSDISKKQKLFLMSWCPDTAKIKKKMLYSSSFDALKHALEGIGKFIQATDMAEASYDCVLEKLRSTDRS
ncbi:cofilin/actin-depolymerizing factor homolog tsr [Oratosquilla oratoria]|uniref:cofilin/actin-depolymerizing factor homolog tsr n=1 Tax=Oratosquilla oratoria TaxID=337810 RepID=UPI003F75E83E